MASGFIGLAGYPVGLDPTHNAGYHGRYAGSCSTGHYSHGLHGAPGCWCSRSHSHHEVHSGLGLYPIAELEFGKETSRSCTCKSNHHTDLKKESGGDHHHCCGNAAGKHSSAHDQHYLEGYRAENVTSSRGVTPTACQKADRASEGCGQEGCGCQQQHQEQGTTKGMTGGDEYNEDGESPKTTRRSYRSPRRLSPVNYVELNKRQLSRAKQNLNYYDIRRQHGTTHGLDGQAASEVSHEGFDHGGATGHRTHTEETSTDRELHQDDGMFPQIDSNSSSAIQSNGCEGAGKKCGCRNDHCACSEKFGVEEHRASLPRGSPSEGGNHHQARQDVCRGLSQKYAGHDPASPSHGHAVGGSHHNGRDNMGAGSPCQCPECTQSNGAHGHGGHQVAHGGSKHHASNPPQGQHDSSGHEYNPHQHGMRHVSYARGVLADHQHHHHSQRRKGCVACYPELGSKSEATGNNGKPEWVSKF